MKLVRLLLATALLPLPVHADDTLPRVVVTAERDAEWGSYRHAYKAASFFEKFTRSRPLIQAHMQIRPIDKAASLDGLALRLVGAKTDLQIPVDALGRAVLPMLKQAYEDDAVIRLNRHKDLFYFSGRYSIKEREDGVYDVAELRAACEQLIEAQRDSGYRMRLLGKKCVGIKFDYSDAAPPVQFQQAGKVMGNLPVQEGHPFEDNSMGLYKVALYRFTDWPQQGKLVVGQRPLAIGTQYE
ncbi:MAG: hypothetical protein V4463_07175 [Pseudomonadota bacterium]